MSGVDTYLKNRIIERVKKLDRNIRIALIVDNPHSMMGTNYECSPDGATDMVQAETVTVRPLTIAHAFFKLLDRMDESDARSRRDRALDRIRSQPYFRTFDTRLDRMSEKELEDFRNEHC